VFAHSVFWTIGFISIAIFFWMWWSISVHTLPGDYFPARAVGSVYGIAGTGSTVGSVISTWAVGRTVDLTHSYVPVFVGIGIPMPVAMAVGFAMMRRVEPVTLRTPASS
jgi:MFS transporter, ACS family, hexuronate transporter